MTCSDQPLYDRPRGFFGAAELLCQLGQRHTDFSGVVPMCAHPIQNTLVSYVHVNLDDAHGTPPNLHRLNSILSRKTDRISVTGRHYKNE